MRTAVPILIVFATARLRAQDAAINLPVGSPLVDGSIYRAHTAAVVVSLIKNGKTVDTQRYLSKTFTDSRNGREVCVVRSEPYPDGPDQDFFSEVVLERRSMALVHIELRDGTGRELVADIEGTHVTGRSRPSRTAATEQLDFTLESPAYYFPFVDAAVGATPLKVGQVFRVPTFGFGPADRHTEWRTYRLARREAVSVLGGPTLNAWVLEGQGTTHQQIWMTDEAPYLPLVLSTTKDGSTRRFESKLLE